MTALRVHLPRRTDRVGLNRLAAYATEQRTKEVGIRKILPRGGWPVP